EPFAQVSDKWSYSTGNQSTYDLSVYGPNGFFRAFKGSLSGQNKASLQTIMLPDVLQNKLVLEIINLSAAAQITITDAYTGDKTVHKLHPAQPFTLHLNLAKTSGWYDLTLEVDSDPTFQQRIAGHLETGKDSTTDPAIAANK
ncbi:MAG TPA: phospholipase domain-containing protein, partial [Edaphobacter sp.]